MNIRFGKLKISPKVCLYLVLFLTLIMNMLSDEFGFSPMIRYLNDVFIFILFVSIVGSKDFFAKVAYVKMNLVLIAMLLYTIVNIVSIVLNSVPLNLVLWAMRNTYRFFVFFWAIIFYFDKKDISRVFDFMYKLQLINVPLIFYQFSVLGLKQDTLGGIFGHGGNAGLLIYSVLLLAFTVCMYTNNECSIYKLLFVFISTSLTCVLAEIRIFYLIAIIIIIVNFFLNRNLMKKIGILLICIILFFAAVDLYSKLFPYVNLSLEALLKEGSSTGGGYNISRLNAFNEINEIFFDNDLVSKLFGYGFGNCEYSNIPIFCSDFYEKYGTYNYRWFTNQWIYLETGCTGIITYLSIFIANLIYSFKYFRFSSRSYRSYHLICIIMTITSIISIVYNSLLKADFGYIAFFSMAISAVMYKENRNVKAYN